MTAPLDRGRIQWSAGAPALREAIEAALADRGRAAAPIADEGPRALLRVPVPAAEPAGTEREVAVKLYARRSGRRGWRDGLKRRLGRDAAEHEWQALAETQRLGLPVPSPRARGRLADGTELVAMEVIDGDRLDVALDAREGEARLAILARLAEAVHALHRHGLCHGDLHAGNVLASTDRLVLIDLQRLQPFEDDAARLADWARLCFSLERGVAWPDAAAALRELAELGPELDPAMRRFLADHRRGRRRRFHRVGRGWRRVRLRFGLSGVVADVDDVPSPSRRGTRATPSLASASTQALVAALEPPTGADLRRDGRVVIWQTDVEGTRVVCKRVGAGGLGRALADRVRGSDARRAFVRGRADALISERAARPLAWVERRVAGVPITSWLLIEPVGLADLDTFQPRSPTEARRLWLALADWLADQHARGLGHRDLKAGNVRVGFDGDAPRFRLVDLGELTGPAPIGEDDRLRALAQLNAAIAEPLAEAGLRRAALEHYAARLPFERPLAEAVATVARASRARAHRWTGRDCRAG